MKTIRHITSALVAAFVLVGVAFADGDGDKKSAPAVVAFNVDAVHSNIGFKVRHLGIANVTGNFENFDVVLKFDPADITTLETEAVIKTASINTGVEKRDNHLRSDDFFNAEAHPDIRFTSTKVTDVKEDGSFKLHGDLTIRDVTQPVVLDAEVRGPVSAMGEQKVAFSAKTVVDRFDYGLKWNKTIEAGGLVVDEEVTLLIEVEAGRELGTN